jgi:hypothetical protein
VSPDNLTTPVVRPLGDHFLVLMRQQMRDADGQPVLVRDANLRVVVLANGNLGWIKSFLLRDTPAEIPTFHDLGA